MTSVAAFEHPAERHGDHVHVHVAVAVVVVHEVVRVLRILGMKKIIGFISGACGQRFASWSRFTPPAGTNNQYSLD